MVRELRSGAVGSASGEDTDSGLGSLVSSACCSSTPGASVFGRHMRVTVCANQGGRKYMEDRVHVHCERDLSNGQLLWSYFAVYDGHGGSQAAEFARANLMRNIVTQRKFVAHTCDQDVLDAIQRGFLDTHEQMKAVVDTWPRTASGYRSTAGTTASVAIVMHGKLYVGHVGDSAVILGERTKLNNNSGTCYTGRVITAEHKPECPTERSRIETSGGQVMQKANVMRVVWHRNSGGVDGPPREGGFSERIPFLAVARSLGDLWSYNHDTCEYVVSPAPDLHCVQLTDAHACLVLGSDGLTNVMRPQNAVDIVNAHEWAEQAVRCRIGAPANLVIFDRPSTSAAASPFAEETSAHMDVDRQLELYPECMVRIGPTGCQRLRTVPLQLYYAGAVDAPEGGPPMRAHELTEDELTTTISYRGPGFSTYTAEHPSNPCTANGSPVKPRFVRRPTDSEDRVGAAGWPRPAAASENRQPAPLPPTAAAPTTGVKQSPMGSASSAPALRAAASLLNNAFDDADNADKDGSPAVGSSHSSAGRKRHYPYGERGTPRPKVARAGSVGGGPTDANGSHSRHHRYPQQYECRKHGLDCDKVKRVNRQWARERGYPVGESPPPPDPAPSSGPPLHGDRLTDVPLTRHKAAARAPPVASEQAVAGDDDLDHELVLSPRAKRNPSFFLDEDDLNAGEEHANDPAPTPPSPPPVNDQEAKPKTVVNRRMRGSICPTPGSSSARRRRKTELDRLLVDTPPSFVGATPANTPATRWSESRRRTLRSAMRGRTPRTGALRATPLPPSHARRSKGAGATPNAAGRIVSAKKSAGKVARGRLSAARLQRGTPASAKLQLAVKALKLSDSAAGSGRTGRLSRLTRSLRVGKRVRHSAGDGKRPVSCDPPTGDLLRDDDEQQDSDLSIDPLNSSDPTHNRQHDAADASPAPAVDRRFIDVMEARLQQPGMFRHHRPLKAPPAPRLATGGPLKRKLAEPRADWPPSSSAAGRYHTTCSTSPPAAKRPRFPWNLLTSISRRFHNATD